MREILSKSNQSKIIGVANFVHKIHILNKLAFITVLGFMLIHEPNGSLECKYCPIVETSLTVLDHYKVPQKSLEFSFETTVFLVNCMPTLALDGISSYVSLYIF